MAARENVAITPDGLLRYFVKSAESKPVFGSKEYVVAQYDDVYGR